MSSSSAGLPRAERATLVTGVGPDEMGVGSDMVRWMEAAAAAAAEDSEKFERPAPGAANFAFSMCWALLRQLYKGVPFIPHSIEQGHRKVQHRH